jgi:hypothetical protein
MRALDGSVSARNADRELTTGRALDMQEPRPLPFAETRQPHIDEPAVLRVRVFGDDLSIQFPQHLVPADNFHRGPPLFEAANCQRNRRSEPI